MGEESAALPLPTPPTIDTPKIKLGKALFNDPLFSKNNTLSCNSCHSLQNAGIDGLPRYRGIYKTEGTLNTPTVLNSKLNFRQFWDGRAKNLYEVIDDHINNKTIFANDWTTIIESIKARETYNEPFQKLYSGEMSPEKVKDALAAFLDNLLTPNSPFDRYLKGDKTALSADAVKGYELFQQYGCITCHEGPNLGGNLFEKLGIYQDYFAARAVLPSDLGLYNVTKKEEDKFVFKVPSLRNIALTGPYLHDGSIQRLEDVIEIMGVYQVGQPIPKFQIPYLIKFLESLNGVQEEK